MKTNWPIKKLGEVAFIRKGTIDPSSFSEETFELYSIPAYHETGEPEIKKGKDIKSSKVIVSPGDCLFGKLNPKLKKVWLVKPPNRLRQIATTEFLPIVSLEQSQGNHWLLPEFIKFILSAPQFQEKVVNKVIGTTGSRQRLNPNDLLEEEIPVPPIEEQRRIVAKLEKILAKIDQARTLRQQSIEETQELIKIELGKIFNDKNWEETEVSKLAGKPQYGYTASATDKPIGPKFLRITDIQNGRVDWEKVPYCKCEEVEKYKLQAGDIIFARTGATVGKSFLIGSTPKKAVFASYLIRLKVKPEIKSEFLYWFFQSPQYWDQVMGHQIGSAQPNMNAVKLSSVKLKMPKDLKEQEKIVAHLDGLSEKVQKLQELQKQTHQELDFLSQSVLHKAFQG